MLTRERRERRAERREEWAASRTAKQGAAFGAASSIADNIPMGQPILVGHHSEKRARRDQNRIHTAMSKGVEHGKMAEHHGRAADTIRKQLDESIYRDDRDELAQLESKLAELEGQRDRRKAINAWLRKNLKAHGLTSQRLSRFDSPSNAVSLAAALMGAASKALSMTSAEETDLLNALQYNDHIGYPSYALSNLSATIKRTRDRLPEARERAAQRARVREALAADVLGTDDPE